MPEVPTTLLFLGDRSPYGLSVARAVMAGQLPLRRVFVPSPEVWQRARARTLRPHAGGVRHGVRLARRAVAATRRALNSSIPAEITGGEPLHPPELDPGVTAGDLERACRAAGVEWGSVSGIRSREFLQTMRSESASLILCAAFPLIFPAALLEIPSLGAINFHPSLLPRCRGCHPVYWTLASGETQGGVTAHLMTPEVDAGNIVAQIPLPLTEADDYGSLYRRAMAASDELVARVERFVAAGGGLGEPQAHERATRFHEDTEEDHRIQWAHRSPAEIIALIRTGEAFTTLRGERIGVLAGREHHTIARERRAARPGRILAVTDALLVVSASGGAVEITRVSWRGWGYPAGLLARAFSARRGEVLG